MPAAGNHNPAESLAEGKSMKHWFQFTSPYKTAEFHLALGLFSPVSDYGTVWNNPRISQVDCSDDEFPGVIAQAKAAGGKEIPRP